MGRKGRGHKRRYTPPVQYVIYDHPRDFPDSFVMRKWLIYPAPRGPEPGPMVKGPTYESVKRLIPPTAVCIGRDPTDDDRIVETWL